MFQKSCALTCPKIPNSPLSQFAAFQGEKQTYNAVFQRSIQAQFNLSSSTISSLEMHSSVWELNGCWNLLSGIVNRAHRSVCCSAWLWGPLEMSNLIGMIGYGAVGSVLPRSNGEGCQQIGRNPNTAQPQSSAVPPNPTSKVKKSSLVGFSLTCSCGFLSISFCFLLSSALALPWTLTVLDF